VTGCQLCADIKARNILLSKEGECKLADFGVSKQLQTHVSRLLSTWHVCCGRRRARCSHYVLLGFLPSAPRGQHGRFAAVACAGTPIEAVCVDLPMSSHVVRDVRCVLLIARRLLILFLLLLCSQEVASGRGGDFKSDIW
jgi:serine/threonine protein kinase